MSESSGSTKASRQSRYVAFGTWPAAKARRPVPSGRQRTSRTRTSDRPRFSASQSGDASSSGRAWAPDIAAYHTDPMPAFTDTPADREKLAAIRAALPATRAGIYLNTGTCGPIPAESAAAMRQAEDRELAVGRASRDAHEELLDRMAEARGALAAVLGTDIDGVALTHSTTDGINLALGTLDWRPGDRALTTNHEHPGVLGPLAAVRDRHGIDVRIAEIGDGGDDDRTLGALERELGTGGVRLVAISHVLWTTGAVLPVAEIVRRAHAHGAVVVLDGAQAPARSRSHVDDLGADFYAVSGQKWLLGPGGHRRARRRAGTSPARACRRSRVLQRGDPVRGRPRGALGRCAALRGRRLPRAVDRRASPGARAGSRCRSGCPGRTRVPPAWPHAAAVRLGGTPGVTLVTPPRPDGDAGHVPDRGLAGRARRRGAGAPRPRDRPVDPGARRGPHLGRLLHHRRGARGACWTRSRSSPATRPRRCRRARRSSSSSSRPRERAATRGPVRRRSWLEVRWRQFHGAPAGRPGRAQQPCSSRSCSAGCSSPTTSPSTAAPSFRAGTCGPSSGSRSSSPSRAWGPGSPISSCRSRAGPACAAAWSAALGLFAALPIAYLALVVLFQVVKPLLGR